MSYFTPEMHRFFKALEKNNTSAWFADHRKEYEQHVKEPFEHLITDLLAELVKRDPAYSTFKARDCIFRINRDIRFSKNKDPYKLNLGAAISPGGKKSEVPGLYIQFSHKENFVAGGCWELQPASLYKVRQEISYHYAEFQKLVKAAPFKKLFGEIKGEELKRAPKDFEADTDKMPILKKKQFYYAGNLEPKDAFDKNIIKTLIKYYDADEPVNQFFRRAIDS